MNLIKQVSGLPLIVLLISNFINTTAVAQTSHIKQSERIIDFPDLPGFITIKADFHQHTVFSDGSVWPDIRVQEAEKDGLDAISITDHLEYTPHKKDIHFPDRNRPFQIATQEANKSEKVIVINGAEITREMPPGHANAIFLEDATKLVQDNVWDAFKEAKGQGAFIIWNHPSWIAQTPTGVAELMDMHKQLINEGMINGIEVVNGNTFSEEALQIAIDNELTIMGTSDIHGLIDWDYNIHNGGHRPVTLVFAEEKTEDAIKEALFNRRTIVWFNNTLIGDSVFLVPLIQESLTIQKTQLLKSHKGNSLVRSIYIENDSDAEYILENQSGFKLNSNTDIVTIKPHETTTIHVKTVEELQSFELKFKVLNALIAPEENPFISFSINIEK